MTRNDNCLKLIDIFFGKEGNNYDTKIFNKIFCLTFETCVGEMDKKDIFIEQGILSICFEFIMNSLKIGENLKCLCQIKFFTSNPVLKSVDEENLIIVPMEKYNKNKGNFIEFYRNMGLPVPFCYLWKNKKSFYFKFNLSSFSYIFEKENTVLFSFGEKKLVNLHYLINYFLINSQKITKIYFMKELVLL